MKYSHKLMYIFYNKQQFLCRFIKYIITLIFEFLDKISRLELVLR